jgi:hypothetical protein
MQPDAVRYVPFRQASILEFKSSRLLFSLLINHLAEGDPLALVRPAGQRFWKAIDIEERRRD